MNKYEFVQSLRKALTGKIDGRELEETIRYYEDYIDSEIKKGKSETQVLNELGDPRLIARNIVSVRGIDKEMYERNEYEQEEWQYEKEENYRRRVPFWVIGILIVLLAVVVLGIVFSVIWTMLPIVIPILLIILLYRYFWGR